MYTHFIHDNASPSLRGGHLYQTWAGCSYLRLRIQIQLLALRATEPGDLHKSCFALGGVPTALPGSETGDLSQIPAGRSKPERQLNSAPLWTLLPDPSRRRRKDQADVPATALPLLSGVPKVSSHKRCWAPAHFFWQLSSFSHHAGTHGAHWICLQRKPHTINPEQTALLRAAVPGCGVAAFPAKRSQDTSLK